MQTNALKITKLNYKLSDERYSLRTVSVGVRGHSTQVLAALPELQRHLGVLQCPGRQELSEVPATDFSQQLFHYFTLDER